MNWWSTSWWNNDHKTIDRFFSFFLFSFSFCIVLCVIVNKVRYWTLVKNMPLRTRYVIASENVFLTNVNLSFKENLILELDVLLVLYCKLSSLKYWFEHQSNDSSWFNLISHDFFNKLIFFSLLLSYFFFVNNKKFWNQYKKPIDHYYLLTC